MDVSWLTNVLVFSAEKSAHKSLLPSPSVMEQISSLIATVHKLGKWLKNSAVVFKFFLYLKFFICKMGVGSLLSRKFRKPFWREVRKLF